MSYGSGCRGDVPGQELLLADDLVHRGDGSDSKRLATRKAVGGCPRVALLFSQLYPRYVADSWYAGLPW